MSQPAPFQVQVEVGGRTLTLETGKLAKQANGAIVARYGETVAPGHRLHGLQAPTIAISCLSPLTIASTPTRPEKFPAASSSAKAAPRNAKF